MINSDETIIEFDNAKRKKIIFIPIGIIAFSVAMIALIVTAEKIKLFYLSMFILVIFATIYFLIKLIKSINNDEKVGLMLNDKTLKFNGTPLAKSVGEVSWSDVESLSSSVQFGTQQIYVKLKNPSKYILKLSGNQMADNGFFINASELKISAEALEKLLLTYFEKYANSSISDNF